MTGRGVARLAGLGLLTLAILPAPAMAAGKTASATGRATAKVIRLLRITQVADLDFGVVRGGSRTGSVRVPPVGSVTYANTASSGCVLKADSKAKAGDDDGKSDYGGTAASCPSPHPMKFSVTGEPGFAYTISLPASITVSGTWYTATVGAPPVLTATALEAKSTSVPATSGRGVLSTAGTDAFQVGGTLTIPANLKPARYRVVVPVTVKYS